MRNEKCNINSSLSPEVLYLFTLLSILISISAIVINGYILLTIARSKSLQVLENTFLANLAGLDILAGLANLGYPIVWNNNNSTQCIWLMTFTTYTVMATLAQVTLMTLDKYIRIVNPFLHVKICNKRNVILATGIVHAFAIGTLPLVFLLYQDHDSLVCSVMFTLPREVLLSTQAFVFSNIAGIAFLNVRILYISWKKKNTVQVVSNSIAQSEGVQGVKVLAVVVMFMFILYVPAWTQFILQASHVLQLKAQENFAVFSILLWMMTPMVDGIAFLFCRQDIRKCAWKLIRCK